MPTPCRPRRWLLLAAFSAAVITSGCSHAPPHAMHSEATANSATPAGPLAPRLANLGRLRMPVSTRSAEAQAFINQGITLVYGFNHAEALRSFREAARLDPALAMAHWGQALALAPNINDSAIGPDREEQGQAAIAEAVKRRANASPREQALIDALAARFSGDAKRNRPALNEAYATAMTRAYASHSDDPDVATLYADAVMNTMPWNYWLAGRQAQARHRRIPQGARKRHPSPPGPPRGAPHVHPPAGGDR